MNLATSKTIIGAIKNLPPKELIIVVDWVKKHETELQTATDQDDKFLSPIINFNMAQYISNNWVSFLFEFAINGVGISY